MPVVQYLIILVLVNKKYFFIVHGLFMLVHSALTNESNINKTLDFNVWVNVEIKINKFMLTKVVR